MKYLYACLMLAAGWMSVGISPELLAGDWPQILGPARNGVAQDETLLKTWPDGKPREVWSQSGLGTGFAGVAVAGDQLILFHRQQTREVVESIDAGTGKRQWKTEFDSAYQPTYTSDDGPRCVPLIHADRIIVYGAQGGLRTLDRKTGKVLWERETHQDFGAPEGYFGAGATPLVDGGLVIVNVGGRNPNTAVIAFDLETGKTVWQTGSELASYSSPVATSLAGERIVIVCARLKTLGIRVRDGKLLFETPFGQRGPTVNGACPLIFDDKLFLSASYGIGAVYATLSRNGLEELWRDDEVMSSQYATCLPCEGVLVGLHGRQDFGPVELRSFDPATRTISSSNADFEYGTLIRAGSTALCLDCVGRLTLLDLENAKTPRIVARASVQAATPRGYRLPALAHGRLYIRDESTLRCLQVGK